MKRFTCIITVVVLLVLSTSFARGFAKSNSGLLWEYVGQVTNAGPSSAQYGNLTNVAGAPSGSSFTFYTTAVNVSVTANGPLRIIDRKGTTTIYQASAQGDFTSPDSFRSGTPVQQSDLRQQVIVNTTNGSFSVVNINTITSTSPLSGDDDETLGEVGQTVRTTLNGQLNTPGAPAPTGWFGGYATK